MFSVGPFIMLQIGGGWSEKFVRFSDLLNWDWRPGLMGLRSVWPALPPRFGLTAKCIGGLPPNRARVRVRAALLVRQTRVPGARVVYHWRGPATVNQPLNWRAGPGGAWLPIWYNGEN